MYRRSQLRPYYPTCTRERFDRYRFIRSNGIARGRKVLLFRCRREKKESKQHGKQRAKENRIHGKSSHVADMATMRACLEIDTWGRCVHAIVWWLCVPWMLGNLSVRSWRVMGVGRILLHRGRRKGSRGLGVKDLDVSCRSSSSRGITSCAGNSTRLGSTS